MNKDTCSQALGIGVLVLLGLGALQCYEGWGIRSAMGFLVEHCVQEQSALGSHACREAEVAIANKVRSLRDLAPSLFNRCTESQPPLYRDPVPRDCCEQALPWDLQFPYELAICEEILKNRL